MTWALLRTLEPPKKMPTERDGKIIPEFIGFG